MPNIEKWLHLCRKARGLQLGEEAVRGAMIGQKAQLVLVAQDAGDSTHRWIRNWSGKYNVPVYMANLTKAELGGVFGRDALAVLAVTHRELGKAITRELQS